MFTGLAALSVETQKRLLRKGEALRLVSKGKNVYLSDIKDSVTNKITGLKIVIPVNKSNMKYNQASVVSAEIPFTRYKLKWLPEIVINVTKKLSYILI